MRAAWLLGLAVVFLVGAAETPRLKLKRPARGFQMRSTPFLVPAGDDREWCEYRRLPIPHGMYAQGVEIRMPEGGHHFVIWAYDGQIQDDSQFPQGEVESPGCVGVAPGSSPLMTDLFGMQVPNGRVKFPKGIATRLKPRQQVFLNPHLKNFGTQDMMADVVFNMTPARKGSVKHLAESYAIGTLPGIHVPAGGTQTIVMEWTAPAPMNLIEVSSHQHKLGTSVDVEVEQAGAFQHVFRNINWEHPYELWTHKESPWRDQSPQVIRLEAGQRMRITCVWTNTTDHVVKFGVKTTDEMCFATGYFYRDDGAPKGFFGGDGCADSQEGLTCPFSTIVSNTTG